jgi:hypothetical protein
MPCHAILLTALQGGVKVTHAAAAPDAAEAAESEAARLRFVREDGEGIGDGCCGVAVGKPGPDLALVPVG